MREARVVMRMARKVRRGGGDESLMAGYEAYV